MYQITDFHALRAQPLVEKGDSWGATPGTLWVTPFFVYELDRIAIYSARHKDLKCETSLDDTSLDDMPFVT